MSALRIKIAELDEESLSKVQSMEEAYGSTILAVQTEYPLSTLSDDQMQKVQELETELGVVLVAYEK